MAYSTDRRLRNKVLYSVFVRNHSESGDFEGVRRDLGRIRDLGADIIWLMPIHPIGEACRKGTYGSPYAIADYRAVNPDYGTEEDLRRLVSDIHNLGMQCIIDVVYNHTSPDSWLAKNHPEWFWRREDGSFGNRIGDWTDIIDLDYSQRGLWEYQAETLRYWAGIVDGFRCDVASLVPLAFWKYAREEVEKVNPDCLWLAESVELSFVREIRKSGYGCLSDGEIFQAFDISYEYDTYPLFLRYLEGRCTLDEYAQGLNLQEAVYPENYVKLRFLENHDKPRTAFILPDERQRRNWTAFLFFQKGLPMIYAGQEYGLRHLPELFEKDPLPVQTGYCAETEWIRRLCALRKKSIFTAGSFSVHAEPEDILAADYRSSSGRLTGFFSMKGKSSLLQTDLPDGIYINLLNAETIEVKLGRIPVNGEPVVIEQLPV